MKKPEIFAQYYQKAQELLNEVTLLYETETCQPEKIMSVLYKTSYITENFITDEELFLRKQNYPDLDTHKKENHEFIDKLKTIHQSYQLEGADALKELKNLLSEWTDDHPGGTDERIKYFLETGKTLTN